MQAKTGTLGIKYEFFYEWKRLRKKEQGLVDLHTMRLGVCLKEKLLFLFDNCVLFEHSGGHTDKILAQKHQYIGENQAVCVYENHALRQGKLGVFWYTRAAERAVPCSFWPK